MPDRQIIRKEKKEIAGKKKAKNAQQPDAEGNKFERMMRILSLLSEREWTSCQKLMDKLHVSRRTILRYIQDINIPFEDAGIGLIESSRDGYKLIDTNFLDTLKGVNDYYTIAAIQSTPFGKTLNTQPVMRNFLIEKIVPRIEISNQLSNEKLEPIFAALTHNAKLDIIYMRSNGTKGNYSILPLKLISNGGIYYLQCYDFGYEQLLNLTVNKIESFETGDPFKETKLIAEKLDYLNSRWGFMANDTKKYIADVTFETDRSIAELFNTNPLHSSMKYECVDGKHRFSLAVHNLLEFIRWSFKYGHHLTITGPEWVIDIAIEEAEKFIARYKDVKKKLGSGGAI